MGAHRLITVILAAGALAGCTSGDDGAPDGEGERGRVAAVADGDTLRLEDGRRVRLVQIDAPEPADECWGREASRELALLAPPGTEVSLERDTRLDDRDRFGRLLRYVRRDGLLLNVELVERGAAAPYFFRGDRGRHAAALLRAANDARDGGRGLWGACPAARLAPERALAAGPARR